MKTSSSRIWTLFVEFISNDDKIYAKEVIYKAFCLDVVQGRLNGHPKIYDKEV